MTHSLWELALLSLNEMNTLICCHVWSIKVLEFDMWNITSINKAFWTTIGAAFCMVTYFSSVLFTSIPTWSAKNAAKIQKRFSCVANEIGPCKSSIYGILTQSRFIWISTRVFVRWYWTRSYHILENEFFFRTLWARVIVPVWTSIECS